MAWKEKKLLDYFRRIPLKDPSVFIGPGDDCAVVGYGGKKHVVTTDLIACGTDFLESTDLYDVGWKCIMVSASDIAAMGCRPLHYVVASDIPRYFTEEQLEQLWQGMYEAAARTSAVIIGGDLSAGDRLLLVSTAIGAPFADFPILRSTAQQGDRIFVTGCLGGSILGKHLNFTARLDAAELLANSGKVSAMMDLSDGLSGDMAALAKASCCDFTIYGDKVPIAPAAFELEKSDGCSALRHSLDDGEDFELLFTARQECAADLLRLFSDRDMQLFEIGEITAAGSGQFLTTPLGLVAWEVGSYEHGA